MILQDASGEARRARTNSFGYYRFDNVPAGQDYVISVSSKRYSFQPKTVFLYEDLVELNFVADAPNHKQP